MRPPLEMSNQRQTSRVRTTKEQQVLLVSTSVSTFKTSLISGVPRVRTQRPSGQCFGQGNTDGLLRPGFTAFKAGHALIGTKWSFYIHTGNNCFILAWKPKLGAK